jgi:hypothetical protein
MSGYQGTVYAWITLDIHDPEFHYVVLCQIKLRQLARLSPAPTGGAVRPGVVMSYLHTLFSPQLLHSTWVQQQQVRQFLAYASVWFVGWQQVTPVLGFEWR